MDLIIFLIIAAGVLSAIGSVIWWVVVFIVAKNAFQAVARDLDQGIPELEQMIRQYNALPANKRGQVQANVLGGLSQMQSQMRRLDALNRERYELRVGELQGMAANAGIDWKP